MAKGTERFADTSAFIAFLDRSDSFHALFRRLFASPPPLATSALVVAEGHGWLRRDPTCPTKSSVTPSGRKRGHRLQYSGAQWAGQAEAPTPPTPP